MTQLPMVFKALADPSRLRIVNILVQRPICVSDLQTILGLSQPFISRHLAYMRKAGLVRNQRDGARVWYSLAAEGLVASALLSFLREVTPLSQILQTDLEGLAECGSSGRLKSCAFVPVLQPVTSASAAEREPPISKAA